MELIVEKDDGSTFSIEVDTSATVLDIKKKIETSLCIPVSNQTVFFEGTLLEEDDLNLKHYKIVNKSLLHLFFSPYYDKPNHDKDQDLHQTEKSSAAPSMWEQESTVMATSNNDQVPPVQAYSLEDIFNNQDSTLIMGRSNDDDQVLNQTQQPPAHAYSLEELLNNQDSTLMARSNNDQTRRSPVIKSYSFEEIFNSQDSSVMARSNEVLNQTAQDSFWPVTNEESWGRSNNNNLQRELSPPSKLIGDFMYGEDKPLSAKHFTNIQSFLPEVTSEEIITNKNQVFQTEQSPVTEQRINTQDVAVRSSQVLQTEKSPPVKEVINVTDSPEKVRSAKKPPQRMRVMMLPYSRERKAVNMFPVDVNASENVEELRKELEKIQQQRPGELNLPEEGYFFIHKQRVLDDDQSFRWNSVLHGDTIEIFPGYVTRDGKI